MKKLITALMLLSLFANAQSVPIEVKAVLEKAGVGENNELLIPSMHDALVREFVITNRGELITFVGPLGDEKLAGILVRSGVKFLTNNDYLTFASAILGEIADGKIDPALGLPILYTGDKEGVLAVNYTDPRIANVLPKVLPRYADNSQHTNFIQKLISGKAKQEHVDWCSAQGLTPAQALASESSAFPATITAPSVLQPPPTRKSSDSKPALTPSNEPISSTPWSLIVILMAAAIGLAWLLLKKRK